MDQQSWLTERFEENRPRLRGVAYRMIGSLSEAEDAVQEAWLRLNRIDTGHHRQPGRLVDDRRLARMSGHARHADARRTPCVRPA
jgi:hypothetical protein